MKNTLFALCLLAAPLARAADEDAVRSLTESRDSLTKQLNDRIAADAAKEAPLDVVLDLDEALMAYGYHQVRPPLTRAPQFSDNAGKSMDRIHGGRMEFAPGREDVRLTFHRRGGQWIGPEIGMISTKLGEQFHLRRADATGLVAGADGVSGRFGFTAARGDFRYDMHFSGEFTGTQQPEWRNDNNVVFTVQSQGSHWPDWWIGPRAALQSYEQRLAFSAGHRRGELVQARFLAPELNGEVYAWVEDGQVRRGYVCNIVTHNPKFNPPHPILALNGWSAKAKSFTAEFVIGVGKNRRTFQMNGTLSDADAGQLVGTVTDTSAKGTNTWPVTGTVYRAFVGTYETDGIDGKWTRPVLAGVAPAAAAKVEWPATTDPVQLYQQVAATDWALREYPLPVSDALAKVREGADDGLKYWRCGQFDGSKGWVRKGSDTHAALAAAWSIQAAYAKALADTARRATTKRQAPVVGLGPVTDPEFAPVTASGDANWKLVGEWDCYGFVRRAYAFETGPYLPEVVVPVAGKQTARLHPEQHQWSWRGVADPADGAVTIPIEPLRLPGELRDPWGHCTEKQPGLRYLDGAYGMWATWYATTTIRVERAERVWLATWVEWDGRVWVNDALVWQPSKEQTPRQLARVPVDLQAGENRITVCVSPRPTSDGNSGKLGPWVHKYGERAYGSFAMWLGRGTPATGTKATDAKTAALTDGTVNRYPDARPALTWDIEKGVNVRWQAKLATDDAEPVIVGDRLFVTTYKGELACLDAASGKELWRQTPQAAGELEAYPKPAITASFARTRRWVAATKTPFNKNLSANFDAYVRSCLAPLADSDWVWMHDPRGRIACFDHAGKQLWAQTVPAQVPRFVVGYGHYTYPGPTVAPPTPPARLGGKVIAAVGTGLAAYDAASGRELWWREVLDYNGGFAVMDVGPGLVLLSSCEVLDAASGKTLIARAAPVMPDFTGRPLVAGNVAYFNACSSAVRFWTDAAGQVRHQLLWDNATDIRCRGADRNNGRVPGAQAADFFGQSTTAYVPTPVLHNGILFMHMAEPNSISHGPQNLTRLNTYDAATGCAVAQRYGLIMNGMRPAAAAVTAGGYLFLADEGSDIGGHFIGFPQGVPMIAVTTAEEQPRRIAESRGLASRAAPVFAGRRMYLAGSDRVVCVERPEALGDKLSEYELAALKTGFFTREIGPMPGEAGEAKLAPPTNFTVPDGVPVVKLESGKTPNQWMFAGPFLVDEQVDVFAQQGGAGAVRPVPGQTVAYTQTKQPVPKSETEYTAIEGRPATATWRVLDSGLSAKPAHRQIIIASYAQALGNPRLTGGINFATASGRAYFTTCYAYTVLEVPKAGAYRVELIAGRIQNQDVYLAGQRIENDAVVQLEAGRYPLLARVALAACGNWEPIEWAIQFRELHAGGPPPQPQPAATGPVTPFVTGAGLPVRLLGQWLLPAGPVSTTPDLKAFKPVPAGAFVTGKTVGDRDSFNVPQLTASYGLDPKALLTDNPNARGLFYAVWDNRRSVIVELECPKGARLWLSGREVLDGETIRLAPGLYPLLFEVRADVPAPAMPAFRAVTDKAADLAAWQRRVRDNEVLLRLIAGSGPAGAYAQTALDRGKTPAAEQQSPNERMRP
jgi:outer membrane protein assembly factor BamB/cell wall-associated NlpC family hydrolase